MQEKNYYIILPITPTNIVGVYGFIFKYKDTLTNIGGNLTLQIIANPNNILEASYRFELSETRYLELEDELLALDADVSESAEVYLEKYRVKMIPGVFDKKTKDNLLSLQL